MALVGNILLGTGAAPGVSSIASAYAESAASSRIPWSALEYSGDTITAISGSAIGGQGGGVTGSFVDYSSKPASNAIHASADQLVVNRYTNGADVLIGKSGMFLYSAGVSAGMAPFEYAANAPVHVLGSEGFSGREGPDAASPKMRLRAASGLQIEGSVGTPSFYSAGVDARGPFVTNTAGTHFLSAKQDKLTFGYDGDSKISSIDGSALAGGGGGSVTPADVSAIASSYANDKLDKTASSTFQPTGNYAYASSLSSKLDSSASSNFAPAGNYAYNSSLSGYLKNSASSTWYPMTGNPSGFLTAHQSLAGYVPKSAISSQSAVWNTVTAKVPKSDISGRSATWNTVSAKLDKTASSNFQPAGNYAYQSSLSSKLDASASSNFAPAGNYAYNSALTGYLKNSASSTWYPMTGNPSSFLTAHQSLAGYVPKSAISAQSATWNTVSAMVPKSAISGRSSTWNAVSAMVPKSAISAQSAVWNTVSAMVPKSSISAQSATWNTVSAKADKSAISSWSSDFVYKSAVSGWSAQIAALSAAISAITANKYTLSAGNGISITNDTANKRTIVAVV